MAGQPTPPPRFEQLRDTESGKLIIVYPVDARELLATGNGRYVHVMTCTEKGDPHPAFGARPQPTQAPSTPAAAPVVPPTAPASATPVAVGEPPAPEAAGAPKPTTPAPIGDVFPPIEQLAAHLAGITDGDTVLAMQAQDQRRSAQPIYEARLTELTTPGN